MVNILIEFMEAKGLTINPSKCGAMSTIDSEQLILEATPLRIAAETIPTIYTYKYLGVTL